MPLAPNGYRRFSRRHVLDLRVYRDLSFAVGPVQARRVMREIRALPHGEAAALVNSLHVGLDRLRADALAAREALETIRAEASADAEPADEDAMTITELAGALGVPAPAR